MRANASEEAREVFVAANGNPVRANDIIDWRGCSRCDANNTLQRLCDSGEIRRVRPGWYVATDALKVGTPPKVADQLWPLLPATVQHLVTTTGIQPDTVRLTLRRMAQDGLVYREARQDRKECTGRRLRMVEQFRVRFAPGRMIRPLVIQRWLGCSADSAREQLRWLMNVGEVARVGHGLYQVVKNPPPIVRTRTAQTIVWHAGRAGGAK